MSTWKYDDALDGSVARRRHRRRPVKVTVKRKPPEPPAKPDASTRR